VGVAMMPPKAFPRARRFGPHIGSRARRGAAAALGLAMSLAGCVTLPIPGGKLVNRDYRPQILVTYVAVLAVLDRAGWIKPDRIPAPDGAPNERNGP